MTRDTECHCGTCTCDPNMTPAVRFDLSPAQQEGVIREHLIRLGWTPPEQQQEQAVACVACEGKPAPKNNPCGWCGRTAPPSAAAVDEAMVERACRHWYSRWGEADRATKMLWAETMYDLLAAALAPPPGERTHQSAAVAAIQFALTDPEGMSFLWLWNEGEFDTLRREWPNAPKEVYYGADPLT